MYDPTFHHRTLSREITFGDQLRDNRLFDKETHARVVEEACVRAASGYTDLQLVHRQVNRSRVYALKSLSDEIVLRKIGRNINRVIGARQRNRTAIINCLHGLCTEAVAFNVYKVDIRKFFESVDTDSFLKTIIFGSKFPPSTARLLETFFIETAKLGITGLPRGLSLSAILSESIMTDFDSKIAQLDQVFFYSRFVDDMIFVTRPIEKPSKFLRLINKYLPDGLQVNASKTKFYEFSSFSKTNPVGQEHKFDFLGYSFIVDYPTKDGNTRARKVALDISDKKVRRLKTRLNVAVLSFLKDGQFDDLVDRVRVLTSNYQFYDRNSRSRVKAGIYHSYNLINGHTSQSLTELDVFYRKLLLSGKGKVPSRLSAGLSATQKRMLLRYSFSAGFREKTYFSFQAQRLSYLTRCWANA